MKIKKIAQSTTMLVMACSIFVFSFNPLQVKAQEFTADDEENVSFALLSQDDISIQGPSDIRSFTFNLPATWEVLDGARLSLSFTTTFNGNSTTSNLVAGTLQVILNETAIGTILLDKQGEINIELPLYLSAFSDYDPKAPHRLQFQLRTPGPCNDSYADYASSFNGGLGILIHSTSSLYLPHKLKPMETDLRRLPYPVYQNSFLPDSAVMVMPDEPSELELSAVFTTAAVMGQLTDGDLSLDTVAVSELSQTQMESSHLIFVGEPSSFNQLGLADWPLSLTAKGFDNPDIGIDDGIIQSALSPFSSTSIWYMVSGLSGEAVVKASQALASPEEIRVTENVGLSIVTDVQSIQTQGFYETSMTFEDLGYKERQRWGPGLQYADYYFNLPAGKSVRQGAFIDLNFAHSAMLDMEGSGMTVALNGDYVGSYRFTRESAKVTTWHLELPSSSFNQGENRIAFTLNLDSTSSCLSFTQLWFVVRPESLLHVEVINEPYDEARALLNKYPSPFVPNFVDTAFIVPQDDFTSWKIASRVAYNLGIEAGGVYIDLPVAFANDVSDTIRNERNMVLIGQPSQMPLFQDMASNMPAPFDVGSDIATETLSGFVFDVSAQIPVGYLEAFPSPWDAQNVVLAITGNGADGLSRAANALIDPLIFPTLIGNMAVLFDKQIITYDITLNRTIAVDSAPDVELPLSSEGSETTQDFTEIESASPLTLGNIAIGALSIVALIMVVYIIWKNKNLRK